MALFSSWSADSITRRVWWPRRSKAASQSRMLCWRNVVYRDVKPSTRSGRPAAGGRGGAARDAAAVAVVFGLAGRDGSRP